MKNTKRLWAQLKISKKKLKFDKKSKKINKYLIKYKKVNNFLGWIIKSKTIYILFIVLNLTFISSCGKNTAKKAAKKIEKKAENLAHTVDDVVKEATDGTGDVIGELVDGTGEVIDDITKWFKKLFSNDENENNSPTIINVININNYYYSEKEILIPEEIEATNVEDTGTEDSLIDVDDDDENKDELEIDYEYEINDNGVDKTYTCTYLHKKIKNIRVYKAKLKSCTDGTTTLEFSQLVKPIKKKMRKNGTIKFKIKLLKRDGKNLINNGTVLEKISYRRKLRIKCEIIRTD